MRRPLLPALALLAIAATSACDDAAQATSPDTAALVASATAWTPANLTADLQTDAATRARLDAGLSAMHASMVELHRRHETALTLEGDERAAYLDDLESDMRVLHDQHQALWASLDPAVAKNLAARIHEQMAKHDDGTMQSFHDRMRRLHDAP